MSRNDSSQLADYVADALAPLGHVATRRFFSGTALVLDGLQFAFVIRDTLYLRVDDDSRDALRALGGTPFRYSTRSKDVEIKSYYGAPAAVLDEADELIDWARRARAVALAIATKKASKVARKRTAKTTDKDVSKTAVKKTTTKKTAIKKAVKTTKAKRKATQRGKPVAQRQPK